MIVKPENRHVQFDSAIRLSGATVLDLAVSSGISVSTLNNWRKGRTEPSLTELRALLAVLSVKNADSPIRALEALLGIGLIGCEFKLGEWTPLRLAVHNLLTRKEWTPYRLAKSTGLNSQTIGRWLAGSLSPRITLIRQIVNQLEGDPAARLFVCELFGLVNAK